MAEDSEAKQERSMKSILLIIINCIMLAIGVCGGPLILRLYFLHGGNSVWLSSFLQTAGFPIMLLPLSISYIIRRRCKTPSTTITTTATATATKLKIVQIRPPLFAAAAIIGILVGLDNYLYSYGIDRLPVSTLSLIVASQLAFTAVFAFFIVKQKFTAYSVNAVVLLTLGSGVLAMNSSGDRPAGESNKKYAMGFVMALLAAVLYGLFLPLVELMYSKTRHAITYSLVLEIQVVISLAATLFCAVGMIIHNNEFKVIPREARDYELGEGKYYVILVASTIIWQCGFLGAIGIVFCASSLFGGILISLLMPVTEILSVVFYKEKFKAAKAVSLILALWGFTSYFYGELKRARKIKKNRIKESELLQNPTTLNP